jgi:mono/diheme cytochrome c family protein
MSLRFVLSVLFLALILSLAGCGGGPRTPAPTVEPIPTPKGGVYEQPTTVITPSATTPTPEATAGPDLTLGQRVYENKCASCHGEKGEGVQGKGKGIASWTMSASEFEDIQRTGGNGKLGNEHLFGMNQISPVGMSNLYAYVQSLLKK